VPDPGNDLAGLLERFLVHLTALGRNPSTVRNHRQALAPLLPFVRSRGCLRAADLRPEDLEAYLAERRERGLAPGYLANIAGALRSFGAWLERAGLVLSDPAAALESGDGDEPLRAPPLSEAQVSALLDAVPARTVIDLRNRALLEVLYGLGLRLQEAIGLILDRPDHVDHRQVRP
jgi:site-specific recombinase XerD